MAEFFGGVEAVVEGFEGDSEFFGGGGFVAVVFLEGSSDGEGFEFFEVEREGIAEGFAELASSEVAGEVAGVDREGVTEDRGVFDDVGEFADVAGPLV